MKKIKFGELSRDMKGFNVGMSMNDKIKKILPMKVVIPEEKIEVLCWITCHSIMLNMCHRITTRNSLRYVTNMVNMDIQCLTV